MELLTFEKTVTAETIEGWTGLTVDEWYKGKGVYALHVGSRGEHESLDFYGDITGLYIRGVDESIVDLKKEMMDEGKDEEEIQEAVDYLEEMAGLSLEENGLYEMGVSEEEYIVYWKSE